jgi:hypothetical protein
MIQKRFNIPALFKLSVLWIAALALNMAVLSYDACAMTTDEEEIAQYAVDEDYDNFARALNQFFELENKPTEAFKRKLLSITYNGGVNLGHKIIKKLMDNNHNFKDLYNLARVTGPDILRKKGDYGDTPLEIGIRRPEKFLLMINGDPRDPDYQKFHELTDPVIKPFVKNDIEPALKDIVRTLIDSLKQLKPLADEEKERGNSLGKNNGEYLLQLRSLETIIREAPSAFKGQRLEILLETLGYSFSAFIDTPEGRELLRTYRMGNENLIDYYLESIRNHERLLAFRLEASNTRRPSLFVNHHQEVNFSISEEFIRTVMSAYLMDNKPIESKDWDIPKLDDNVKHVIFSAITDDAQRKDFLLNYRNRKGQNFAELAAMTDERYFLENVYHAIDDGNAFADLLKSPDSKGKTVLETIVKKSWFEFLEQTDLNLFVIPFDGYNVTPLMVRALRSKYDWDTERFENFLERLNQAGVNVDQRDFFGNDARNIKNGVRDSYDMEITLMSRGFQLKPLTTNIWTEILDFPYYLSNESREFVSIALSTVARQDYSDVQQAFLQMTVNQEKETANKIWRSFFNTYDHLVDEEAKMRGYDQDERFSRDISVERNSPSSIRFLMTASEHLSDEAASNVIAGASSFGVNFNRTATPWEAEIIVRNIHRISERATQQFEEELRSDQEQMSQEIISELLRRDLGLNIAVENLDRDKELVIQKIREKEEDQTTDNDTLIGQYFNAHQQDMETIALDIGPQSLLPKARYMIDKIRMSLIKEYPTEINAEQRTRLLNHQLKCTVVALYSLARDNEWIRRNVFVAHDDDGIFDFIDQELNTKFTAIPPVNSKVLFDEVMDLLPDDSSFKAHYAPRAAQSYLDDY